MYKYRCKAYTQEKKRCKNKPIPQQDYCICHQGVEEFECVICTRTITRLVDSVELRCHHRFCKKCIVSWVKFNGSTCPICRADLDQDLIERYRPLVPLQQTSIDLTTLRIQIPNGGHLQIPVYMNNRTHLTNMIGAIRHHIEENLIS
jgi:hypothetical protein